MSVASGGNVLPTKIELIRVRKSLATARRVYQVLDDKRAVLLKLLEDMIKKAEAAREEIKNPLAESYSALLDAYLKVGPLRLEGTASNTPTIVEVDINLKRIVDVDVPNLTLTEKSTAMTYGFADSSVSMDKASRLMRKALVPIFQAAELDNAIFRLVNQIHATQRLINALQYLVIPRYENSIRIIQATLEEREREDFVRLKHVKHILEVKEAAYE